MTGDLPDLLASRATMSPHAVAIEEVATGRTLTYAELDAQAGRAAAALAALGVRPDDRVATLCCNRVAFWELLFGCARLGALLVPLDGRMPAAELDGLLADAEPVLICHDAALAAKIGALRDAPATLDLDAGYDHALADAPPIEPRKQWAAHAIWYILYTSGTTGRAKGVVYTFRMALANHVNIGSATGMRAGDSVAAFLPICHTAGINLHALPALIAGGRVLLLERFDADALAGLFAARRIDLFFAVPTVYQDLVEHPGFAAAPLEQVRHWSCGGAPLPERLAGSCRDLGIRQCNGMGMTETGPTALLMDPADAWDRTLSVGKPQLLCSARIVDPSGRDVADGAVGELLFSGPGVTPGYWRNAPATRAAFTADGWLRSGDLVRREGGFFYAVGRRKEMYISGGENVYPVEVETVLARHPAILDAAVTSIADPRWGEVGRAFVQFAPGAPPLRCEELTAYCRSRLASFKVPKSFRAVDAFPRTPAGKIQKHRLP